ncbi:RDD family protein [Owenweeksia hongkongensis]|uniref:RDD family protein n=1 Tax=Owenweeksia hongkongensis TaxID=253245 RepID=UPI003A8E9120
MKRITDLKVEKLRTSYRKDSLGNRQQIRTPYIAARKVRVEEGGRRFGHFFIDMIIYSLLMIPVEVVFNILVDYQPSTVGAAIFMSYFPSYIFYALYYFTFEYFTQSTPGKLLTKCIVINEFGQKPTINELIVRSLVRLVPFEALSCLNERGWHDRWSNTWVVQKEENEKLQAILQEA